MASNSTIEWPDATWNPTVGCLMSVDIASRESVVEAMKKFVPANGSIEIDAGGGPKVRLTRDGEGNVSVTEVIEKPVEASSSGAMPGRAAPQAKAEVPAVDGDGAEALGREAFKKAAGRLLDGREHNDFPKSQSHLSAPAETRAGVPATLMGDTEGGPAPAREELKR